MKKPDITALAALEMCLKLKGKTVLDVGSGTGQHAERFRATGWTATTVDLQEADIVGDFMEIDFGTQHFDIVWCAHILEHQQNVGLFLKKAISLLNPYGWLAITVPPMKSRVVGGHLAQFNAGILLYNLILAGIDCSAAKVKTYDYNVSVIVQNHEARFPPLKMDKGDIETLAEFFPMAVAQGFDGEIRSLNWTDDTGSSKDAL